jgi:hypothetical protein
LGPETPTILAKTMASTKPDIRAWTHSFAILFLFVACVLILAALISSLAITKELTSGRAEQIPWLVTFNETAAVASYLDESVTAVWKWGFGPWGFCQWTHDVIQMEQTALCANQALFFWQIDGMTVFPV